MCNSSVLAGNQLLNFSSVKILQQAYWVIVAFYNKYLVKGYVYSTDTSNMTFPYFNCCPVMQELQFCVQDFDFS
jgi:hypothetical protein